MGGEVNKYGKGESGENNIRTGEWKLDEHHKGKKQEMRALSGEVECVCALGSYRGKVEIGKHTKIGL